TRTPSWRFLAIARRRCCAAITSSISTTCGGQQRRRATIGSSQSLQSHRSRPEPAENAQSRPAWAGVAEVAERYVLRMAAEKSGADGSRTHDLLNAMRRRGCTDGARRCATVREIRLSRVGRRLVAHSRGRSVPHNTRTLPLRRSLGVSRPSRLLAGFDLAWR